MALPVLGAIGGSLLSGIGGSLLSGIGGSLLGGALNAGVMKAIESLTAMVATRLDDDPSVGRARRRPGSELLI